MKAGETQLGIRERDQGTSTHTLQLWGELRGEWKKLGLRGSTEGDGKVRKQGVRSKKLEGTISVPGASAGRLKQASVKSFFHGPVRTNSQGNLTRDPKDPL